MEDFENIQGYEGIYQINRKTEKIMRVSTGRILSYSIGKYGDFIVNLSKEGKSRQFKIKNLLNINEVA